MAAAPPRQPTRPGEPRARLQYIAANGTCQPCEGDLGPCLVTKNLGCNPDGSCQKCHPNAVRIKGQCRLVSGLPLPSVPGYSCGGSACACACAGASPRHAPVRVLCPWLQPPLHCATSNMPHDATCKTCEQGYVRVAGGTQCKLVRGAGWVGSAAWHCARRRRQPCKQAAGAGSHQAVVRPASDPAFPTCLQCPDGCAQCRANGTCIKCDEGYTLKGGKCLKVSRASLVCRRCSLVPAGGLAACFRRNPLSAQCPPVRAARLAVQRLQVR